MSQGLCDILQRPPLLTYLLILGDVNTSNSFLFSTIPSLSHRLSLPLRCTPVCTLPIFLPVCALSICLPVCALSRLMSYQALVRGGAKIDSTTDGLFTGKCRRVAGCRTLNYLMISPSPLLQLAFVMSPLSCHFDNTMPPLSIHSLTIHLYVHVLTSQYVLFTPSIDVECFLRPHRRGHLSPRVRCQHRRREPGPQHRSAHGLSQLSGCHGGPAS